MSLTYQVFTKVADLPESWLHAFSEGNSLHPDDLSIGEKSNLKDMEFRYVITMENNQIVYYSFYQLLSVNPSHFNCRDRIFQHYSLNFALNTVRPKLLVVGNLFRHDTLFHAFVNENVSSKKKSEYYKSTFEFILNQTKASGVFLKDVEEEIALNIQTDDSYKQMENDVSMCLYIPKDWESMLDYEKMLKHKYHQRYKKISKQLDGIQIRELNYHEIEQYKEEITNLYLQVSNNQIVSMGKLNAEFYVRIKAQLKERYKVFGWFLDSKLVAFSSAILHDGIYDMNYIGFDYQVNQTHSIYFNIMFHCLEQAILTKSKKLVLGRTALEAKAIMGCEPEFQYGFYKLRHPVVNWFFKKVSAGFKEQIGEKWRDRHPFKSSYYKKEHLPS